MADEKLEGEKLNQLVQLGKKKRLSFAFCPGPKNNHTILIDRIKRPEVIAKTVKKQGEGNKVAFGTFVLNSKTMELTCEQVIPGVGKTLKKFLQTNKILVKILILDADGDVLESDQDDTPDTPTADESTAIRAQGTPDAPANTDSNPAPKAASEPLITDLTAQLKALQPSIAAAVGDVADKWKKVLIAAVSQLKSGDLNGAAHTIAALEGAIAKTETPPKPDGKAPDVLALVARAKAVKDMVGPAGEKLSKALAIAVQRIKDGDLATAETLLGKIEKTLNHATSNPSVSPEAAKWAKTETQLQKELVRLVQEKRGDLKGLAHLFSVAKKQAAAGNFDMALAAAARAAGLIKQAAQDSAPATRTAPSDAAPNTVLYTKTRLDWLATRTGLRKDMEGLKSAIDVATAEVGGLEDVSTKSGVLLDHLGGLDTGLETTLEQLATAADDTQTGALKAAARKIIDQYRLVLDTEFFRAVDDNGFVDTNIRALALASLQQVSAALET